MYRQSTDFVADHGSKTSTQDPSHGDTPRPRRTADNATHGRTNPTGYPEAEDMD